MTTNGSGDLTLEGVQSLAQVADRRELAALLRRLYPGLPLQQQLRLFVREFQADTPIEEGPAAVPSPLAAPRSSTLSFRQTVPAATKIRERRYIGQPSRLIAAFFHFPPGPSFLVEVRLNLRTGQSERQVVPFQEGDFVAGDNTPVSFTGLDIELPQGSQLVAEWNNHDATYSHTVPIFATVGA